MIPTKNNGDLNCLYYFTTKNKLEFHYQKLSTLV